MNRIKLISIVVLLALASLTAFEFLGERPVLADQVTFYPTVDSYMREDYPDTNYGIAGMCIDDFYDVDDEHRARSVMLLENQSGAGNVTEVLLKLYYYDWFGNDPDGRSVRVYRLTDSFEEYEVTWLESEDGDSWTSPGGDYTTANYVQFTMPGSFGWITINITNLAKYTWETLAQDLYILIRYRYENKDWETDAWAWFTSAEDTVSGWRPQLLVTYAEEIQTPIVEHTVDEYGDDYIDLEITPTLYDYGSATVYAQGCVNASGNYTIESAGLNVTTDDPVIRSLTGLNYSTLYGVRAKLVYSGGTVYSNATNVTTMSYHVPTWTTDVDDISVRGAQVYAGWTGNNNSKLVYARVAYRDVGVPTWSYTSQLYSTATANEYNWVLSGLGWNALHYYKGVYTIDGYEYESDVANFTTLVAPYIHGTVTAHDLEYFTLKADYQCNGADEVDVYCKIRKYDEWDIWTYSDTRNGLTGNGSTNFTFNDLTPQTRYVWQVYAVYDTDYASEDAGSLWTESIGTYPDLTNLTAQFIAPYTLRLSMTVDLNDVEGMDAIVRFWLECYPYVPGDEYFSAGEKSITTGGVHYVDVVCGEQVDWDQMYYYYGELDYVVATNQTAVKVLTVPAMPYYVMTLQPDILSGTSVRLNGWRQMGDCFSQYGQGALASFVYWKTGDLSTLTMSESQTVSGYTGSWSTVVTGLVYGQNYSYKAYEMSGCVGGDSQYGQVVTFTAGYNQPPVVIPSYTSIWTWLTQSSGGHWSLILLAMGVTALIFFRKHRTITVVLCLMILGLAIVIGWVDPWIIVLMALGGGLYVWRKLSGSHSTAD